MRTVEELRESFIQGPITYENIDKHFGNAVTHINQNDVDIFAVEALIGMIYRNGIIQPVRYEDVKDFGYSNILIAMYSTGLYTFPTMEVIEFLKNEIDDNDPDFSPDAIEICAGTGWIGRSLDIPITDSKIQEREDIRKMYMEKATAPIEYPSDVEKLDAISAIRKYQPEYVIGSYVTRLWGLGSKKTGSVFGVHTGWVVNNCHKFFMIGNYNVHGSDPIMKRNHKEYSFPWLLTRGDWDKARIFVWENKQW